MELYTQISTSFNRETKSKKAQSLITFLVLSLISITSTQAALVSYNFTGTGQVFDSTNLVGGNTTGSEQFSGSFSYDTSLAVPIRSSSSAGSNPYESVDYSIDPPLALNHITLSFRDISVVTNPDNPLLQSVTNSPSTNPNTSLDKFLIYAFGPISPDVTIEPVGLRVMTIDFDDYTGEVFSDELLPASINYSDFDNIYFSLAIDDSEGLPLWGLSGQITSITAVPIPAAIWLFSSGLLGLIGLARRKKA